MKKAIVIFSHTVGVAVIRALGRMGVPVVVLHYRDCEVGHLSKYVHEKIKVPDPVLAETDFLSKLISISDRLGGGLLIPTDDFTVVSLSRNKELLEKFYCVSVADWDLVKRLIRKQYTYEFADSIGIPCPKTFVPRNLEDLKVRSIDLPYPALIKPCEGHRFFANFGVKMFRVDNGEELEARYNQATEIGLEVMVQEIIPGDDTEGVNYNSYFVNGNPVAEFTAKKVRIEPPFFGSPRVIKSKKIPELFEPGRRLLRKLDYEGFSCMEFKRDTRDGTYKLMEINCRNNLSGSLAVKCGINFPWIMYRHMLYGEVNLGGNFEPDVYWIDLAHDIKRFFVSRQEEKYTLKEYITPYLGKKVFAVLSLSDPLPFLKRLSYFGKLGISKLLGKAMRRSKKDGLSNGARPRIIKGGLK